MISLLYSIVLHGSGATFIDIALTVELLVLLLAVPDAGAKVPFLLNFRKSVFTSASSVTLVPEKRTYNYCNAFTMKHKLHAVYA